MLKLLAVLLVGWVGWCLAASSANHYATLQVRRTATQKEIAAAYRSLAREYHPDKNPGDESSQAKFIELTQAYEVLSDPRTKAGYDASLEPRARRSQSSSYEQGERTFVFQQGGRTFVVRESDLYGGGAGGNPFLNPRWRPRSRAGAARQSYHAHYHMSVTSLESVIMALGLGTFLAAAFLWAKLSSPLYPVRPSGGAPAQAASPSPPASKPHPTDPYHSKPRTFGSDSSTGLVAFTPSLLRRRGWRTVCCFPEGPEDCAKLGQLASRFASDRLTFAVVDVRTKPEWVLFLTNEFPEQITDQAAKGEGQHTQQMRQQDKESSSQSPEQAQSSIPTLVVFGSSGNKAAACHLGHCNRPDDAGHPQMTRRPRGHSFPLKDYTRLQGWLERLVDGLIPLKVLHGEIPSNIKTRTTD